MSTNRLASLPKRLAHAREAAGLNRSALALRAGLNPSHVRLIEEGEREDPTGTTLAKLAEALEVSLDWLVRGIGPAPRRKSRRAPAAPATDAVALEHDATSAPDAAVA